jgi:lysophospholipase L1-like esterase
MQKKDQPVLHGQTKIKKILYYITTLLIPFFVFFVLEISLQLFKYGGDSSLFIPTPDKNSPYYGINTKIGSRYFNQENFSPTPRKDLFLIKKPDNGYRIFVLGGSTTAGFPYGNNITFPRILHRRLVDTFPQKHIELINMSMTAINSYTLLDFMDEIVEQKPDALLIYFGHNEYYGSLGVGSVESLGKNYGVVRVYLKLQKYKTVLLLRNIILYLTNLFKDKPNISRQRDNTQTEMSRIVKEKNIFYKDELYELGKKQFYHNLAAICKKSKEAGVDIILSELVSNIRDQFPFSSKKNKDYPSALDVYKKAQKLEQEGKFEEAKKGYYYAKDLDPVRFRAPEEFNEIIRKIGDQYHIPVIAMKKYFESASPNGLIGKTLMYEHLHPNIDGYFLMADAFYLTMKTGRFISSNWDKKQIKPSLYYRKTWGWTGLDSVYAYLNIIQLKGGWPFKKAGPNLALSEFLPENRIDSIALQILTNEQFTLELGHIQLAKYYLEKGNPEKAFEEYRALIYTVPYLDLFYEPAVKLLLDQKEYAKAFYLLYDGIKYNRSGFMYKWLGQFSLVLDFTEQGIRYLNKAREFGEQDEQLLYNLGRAHYNLSRIDEGDHYLEELKKIYPRSPLVNELKNFKEIIIHK